MGWAKFDDGYAIHPKLRSAGGGGMASLAATGLDARATTHCARYETDGYLSEAEVVSLAGLSANAATRVAGHLVEGRKWHKAPHDRCECWTSHSPDDQRTGYWVHDFLRYHHSRKTREAKREADRVRKESERNPSSVQPDTSRTQPLVRAESERTSCERAPAPTPAGVPTLPYPDPPPPQVPPRLRSVPNQIDEEEEDSGIEKTVRLIAERRLKARLANPDLTPIGNRAGWLTEARARCRADHGEAIAALLAQGLDPPEIADRLEAPPAVTSPYVPFEPMTDEPAAPPPANWRGPLRRAGR